ncbi:MAG: glutamate 5-kinase [Pseudomonadota bacterium]
MNPLAGRRRIVVKVGSSLLVDPQSGLKRDWLSALADDLHSLSSTGAQILLVSSGAIALGRTVLGLPARALRLDEAQAAASVGQIALAQAWSEVLAARDHVAAQVLLTLRDTEGASNRRAYLNARDTLAQLLAHGAVPVVNENDTVATSEIRYGDNDRLAARVATMAAADMLVLLSDIDGLYTAPPTRDPTAELIPHVPQITDAIAAMAGDAGSHLSRGGMVTKIEAARIATSAGCAMVIASGKPLNPLQRLKDGGPATLFDAQIGGGARKAWISGQLAPTGRITIDAGAARALAKGNSLLAAGVTQVQGPFERGDVVAVEGPDGTLGRGLTAYSSKDATVIAGLREEQISEVLGGSARSTLIHADDIVLAAAKRRG